MIIRRTAKDTLTPVEMFHGDTLRFTRLDGAVTPIALKETGAEIMHTTLPEPAIETHGAKTAYRFWGDFEINGQALRLEREVGTQGSFYEPWVYGGVRRWANCSEWALLSAHMTEVIVPEHTPLQRGTPYAIGAGIRVGVAEHSHFTFSLHDLGDH